jgi:geranyl-CoA carboxylase alpha subunit
MILADETGEAWQSAQWREAPLRLVSGGESMRVGAVRHGYIFTISIGGKAQQLRLIGRDEHSLRFEENGHVRTARYALSGAKVYIDVAGRVFEFEDTTFAPPKQGDTARGGVLRAPMSGRLMALEVKAGDRVKRGQVIAVIEAMKMEHEVMAPIDGCIESVASVSGAQVAARDVLVTIAADTPG